MITGLAKKGCNYFPAFGVHSKCLTANEAAWGKKKDYSRRVRLQIAAGVWKSGRLYSFEAPENLNRLKWAQTFINYNLKSCFNISSCIIVNEKKTTNIIFKMYVLKNIKLKCIWPINLLWHTYRRCLNMCEWMKYVSTFYCFVCVSTLLQEKWLRNLDIC